MTDLWEPVSGIFWRSAPLVPDIGWSVDYGALFTSVVGALAGAGIGAWTAGYISERNKVREQLTKEIRDTNAAIVLSLGIMNCGIALKKQHVKELQEDYDAQRGKCREIIVKMAAGHPQTEIPQINLLELQEIAPPVVHLQDIVLSRLSTVGRALSAATALTDAVVNLNTMLARRNELITRFKNNDFPPGASKEHFCFGLRYGNGQTNEEYGDSVKRHWLVYRRRHFFRLRVMRGPHRACKIACRTVRQKKTRRKDSGSKWHRFIGCPRRRLDAGC